MPVATRHTRFFSVLLSLALGLLLALPGPALAQELPPGGTFVDDDATIYEPSIEAIAAAGITRGCGEQRYCPFDPVTREQMASFLARALDGLSPTEEDFFPDDEASPHEENINLLAANDIVMGFTDGTFGPDLHVTRGQMASFLARSLEGLTPTDQDFFPDDEASPHEEAINLLAANDIVRGFGDGTYRPETDISRGEMAIMLTRALDLAPIDPPARPIPVEPIAAVDASGRVVLLDAFTGLTKRVLMEGIAVDDPADNGISLAPDHQTVYVEVPGQPEEQSRIVSIDTATGDISELVQGSSPAVSPDGSRLAYVEFVSGDLMPEPVIVVRDLDDGSERRFAGVDEESTPVFIADLAWTTDGTRLAYVAGEIQTGVYLLDLSTAENLADATRLGPTAREEGSSWYDVANFESGLAVAERCCDLPAERYVTLLLSLDPLEVEGPLLPTEVPVTNLSSAGESTLVYIGDLGTDLAGTLYWWEAGIPEARQVGDGFVVADG